MKLEHSTASLEKYDFNWKRHVDLPEFETQLLVLESEEPNIQNIQNISMIITPSGQVQQGTLHFLDDPGLKMCSIKCLGNVMNWFLPLEFYTILTDATNNLLHTVISQSGGSEQMYNKKKYKESEIQQLLGMHLLFGIYQFNTLDEYWHAEQFIRGGLESCMLEGRFNFLDQHFLQIEHSKDKLVYEVNKMRKKLNQVYKPDQELILAKSKSNDTIYLLDQETAIIVDILRIESDKDQNDLLLAFLHPYLNKNHVLYFMFPVSLDLVASLEPLQLYAVAECLDSQSSINLAPGIYRYEALIIEKNQSLFVYPQKQLVVPINYLERLNQIHPSVNQHLQNMLTYRSPFEVTSQIRADFQEYFEAIIHNSFLIVQGTSFKTFRQEVAKVLLGDKAQQIERDRKEAKRKQNSQYVDSVMNTDQLGFGLLNQYDENCHTPMPQSEDETFKYCPVCMKFDGLSKPYYRCMACEKLFSGRVFLCPFPCFEYFHLNPSGFLHCNIELLQPLGENYYFKPQTVTPLLVEEINKKKNLQKQPLFKGSFNKELYKEKALEDKNLDAILNSLKKPPPLPSPNFLQPIHHINPGESNQTPMGHRKDMSELEQLQRENAQRQQDLDDARKERELEAQPLSPQRLPTKKKEKKTQKVNQKQTETIAEPEKFISPLEQFMAQIKKRTKVEEDQE